MNVARRIVFRPEVEDDALEVRDWYEARRPGLGREFGEALDLLLSGVVEGPLAFPRVHFDTPGRVIPLSVRRLFQIG